MDKNDKVSRGIRRQQPQPKIIVERHYVGTEKMETVFKWIAEEQITKKVKEIAENKAFQWYYTSDDVWEYQHIVLNDFQF